MNNVNTETIPASLSSPAMNETGWQGTLKLDYEYRQNKTVLAQSFVTAPLKVQRSFYPEGEEFCHTVMLHTAGGIVGGDRLSQSIQLQPKSQVLLTTAAASKIYRSDQRFAQQNINIQLAEQSYLEWLPQETIIFNEAYYEQKLHIELAAQAHFCGWEINRLGRTARGETFLAGEWRSRWEIWRAGKPLWIDRQQLIGSETTVQSPNALGGMPIVATFIWIGQAVNLADLQAARYLGETLIKQGKTGLTLTQGDGLFCRYRGDSTAEVRKWFSQLWDLLRSTYGQRQPIRPRVWSL
jgi:urease accessory protein